jgi:DNA (cytosine-5)-methyltransferase 1
MKLLDLYSCQGGAAYGYHQAGFDVTGVDITPQPRYPFKFIKADAIEYVKAHGHEYDAIHASPPCQRFTHGNVAGTQADRHPDLIGPTRDALIATGKPFVIENVPRAPLENPLTLCGTMFGLTATDDDGTTLHLKRHRWFESNILLYPPRPCHHPSGVQWAGAYGGARRDKHEARNVRKGGYVPPVTVLERLLKIGWMTEHGLFQSIPPAYTRHLGEQLIAQALVRMSP